MAKKKDKSLELQSENVQKPQKLGIKDLIAKKAGMFTVDTVEYFSYELGGIIEIKKIPRSRFRDILALGEKGASEDEIEVRLIYECCPLLQDPELHKAYDIVAPYDIVGVLFDDNIQELGEICDIIFRFYGFEQEVIDRLKKQ